ncbi:MAG: hypothetical protein Q4C98_01090 [Capnocytophaga sp.]|nr:hypothetical protein [Capnocytophaga sp.]
MKAILEIYKQNFQIEFLYRGAKKQFTGLNHCEARSGSENKINFHWNASLTAINLAKIEHRLPLKNKHSYSDIVFSIKGVKKQYYNKLLLKHFILIFGINPKLEKNRRKIKQLLDFGKIATLNY